MQYTVLGFSTEIVSKMHLDGTDLYILRWFIDFFHTGRMKKIVRHDDATGKEKVFVWVRYEAVLEDMPFLGMTSKKRIAARFDNLCNAGILEKSVLKGMGGTYTCFHVNEEVFDTLVAWQREYDKGNDYSDANKNSEDYLNNASAVVKTSSEVEDQNTDGQSHSPQMGGGTARKWAVAQPADGRWHSPQMGGGTARRWAVAQPADGQPENPSSMNSSSINPSLNAAAANLKKKVEDAAAVDSNEIKCMVMNAIQETFGNRDALDQDFYAKAAGCVSENMRDNITQERLTAFCRWLGNIVKDKKVKSKTGFFCYLFFQPSSYLEFKGQEKAEENTTKSRHHETVICPICGAAVDKWADTCPSCGFSVSYFDNEEEIFINRQVHDNLNHEQQNDLKQQLEDIMACHCKAYPYYWNDPEKAAELKKKVEQKYQEFGIVIHKHKKILEVS